MSDDPPDADLTKRIAELIDGDAWQLADLLAEHYPADQWGDGSKANSDLYAELRKYELAVAREYGAAVTGSTLRIYRATALAWPDDTRVSSAAFGVHLRMRGPDRRDEMATRLRQAKSEGRALSIRMLMRYRADERHDPPRPFDDRIRRAIANAVRRELLGGVTTTRTDWWMTVPVHSDARAIAVRELRRLADAIDAGPVPDG